MQIGGNHQVSPRLVSPHFEGQNGRLLRTVLLSLGVATAAVALERVLPIHAPPYPACSDSDVFSPTEAGQHPLVNMLKYGNGGHAPDALCLNSGTPG